VLQKFTLVTCGSYLCFWNQCKVLLRSCKVSFTSIKKV